MAATPRIAVTDHAQERYRQRVRGTLDARGEIVTRVTAGWAAERTSPGTRRRGSVDVRDGGLIFVCLHDQPRGELLVVTLWEEGDATAVPRRFTDAIPESRLRRDSDAGEKGQ